MRNSKQSFLRLWNRKRWIVATGVYLIVLAPLYVSSIGPASYCAARGWLPWEDLRAIYRPVLFARQLSPRPVRQVLLDYLIWWESFAPKSG